MQRSTVRLGLVGESGSGKSSLINAIVGQPVAPVGALHETTLEPKEYEVRGVTLVDLPGYGTKAWPRDSYIEKLDLLKRYDGFILVTATRLREGDVHLFTKLHKQEKKPCFLVRSHFDSAVADVGKDAARSTIEKYLREQLESDPALPIYMISSAKPPHYDLARLIEDISKSLPETKRHRFAIAAMAYSRELLQRKQEAAQQWVLIYAGLSALNGANPIPGLDCALDLGLLAKMAYDVVETYGFTDQQLADLRRSTR